ncbi:MAG: hypothetical protein AAFU79_19210 [Myxococcota bacterium]
MSTVARIAALTLWGAGCAHPTGPSDIDGVRHDVAMCAQRALREDPSVELSLEVRVRATAEGQLEKLEVVRGDAPPKTGASRSVSKCIARRSSHWSFGVSEGDRAWVLPVETRHRSGLSIPYPDREPRTATPTLSRRRR